MTVRLLKRFPGDAQFPQGLDAGKLYDGAQHEYLLNNGLADKQLELSPDFATYYTTSPMPFYSTGRARGSFAADDAWAGANGVSKGVPIGAVCGDSRHSLGFTTPADVAQGYRSQGWTTWLRQRTRQRFDIPLSNVFAIGGTTTQHMAETQLPQLLAAKPAFCFAISSTNDRTTINPATGALYTAAESIAFWGQFINGATKAGIQLYIVAETPRGNSTQSALRFSGQTLLDHLQVHRWLQQQAQRPLVTVFDFFNAWTLDPLSTTLVDVDPTKVVDGLHAGGGGANDACERMRPTIEARFPPVDILPVNNTDLFSAGNPRGSLTPNPMMAGTSGTLTATGGVGTLTGQVAGNSASDGRVRLINGTGLTVAASVVVINGRRWQQFAISGTPTQNGCYVEFNHFGTYTVTAGDVVEAVCEYEVDAGQTGITAVQLQITQPGGSKIHVDGQANSTTPVVDFPTTAVSGVLRTPSLIAVQDGTPPDSFRIDMIPNVAASATVRMRAIAPRKII